MSLSLVAASPVGAGGDELDRIDQRPGRRAQRAGATRISQRLRDDLTKAGFTDITIMPSSFLVRAKDSQGNSVMMVIDPDSLSEVTEHSGVTEHKDAPLAGAIKANRTVPIPSPSPKP